MTDRLNFVDSKEFKKIHRDAPEGNIVESVGIHKYYTVDSVEVVKGEHEDDESRILRFIITTESIDRDNDTISVDGWDVSNFLKNPVVLFGHDARNPPVAKALNLIFDTNNIKSEAEFMPRDMSEFSDMIFKMYKGGFMNAISVGFSPDEFNFDESRGGFGVNFIKQELLEYSVVPVPSNPESLQIARSKGIDTGPLKLWAEEILDEDKSSGLYIPKSVIEKIHKDSEGKSKVSIWMGDNDVIEFESDIKEVSMAKEDDVNIDKDSGSGEDTGSKVPTDVAEILKAMKDTSIKTVVTIVGEVMTIESTPIKEVSGDLESVDKNLTGNVEGGDPDLSTEDKNLQDGKEIINIDKEDLEKLIADQVSKVIRKAQGKLD